MATWFTADPQFGDKPTAAHRGYSSVEKHDDVLMMMYAAAFKPNDTVWWLGDVTTPGMAGLEVLMRTVRVLPGNHHLVLGNNDVLHPMHGHEPDTYATLLRTYLTVFDSVSQSMALSLDGTVFNLSHFPYRGDVGDKKDRFVEWRMPLNSQSRPILHGHVHSEKKVSFPSWHPQVNVAWQEGKAVVDAEITAAPTQIHVGWEAWKGPVLSTEVMSVLATGE